MSWLSLAFGLLLLSHACVAQIGGKRTFGSQSECRIDRLTALQTSRRVQSEAGQTEYYDENDVQCQCAGISAMRRTIEPRGLLLPSFSNSPRLIYIIQGKGIFGTVIPGCPESYQSFEKYSGSQQKYSEGGKSQSFQDEHQKIHHFRQGDIIALPAGVAEWCYNNGDSPIVAISVYDTSNNVNQLDKKLRQFQLAGSQQTEQSQHGRKAGSEEISSNNIFSGFDTEVLADALGVSTNIVRKLQKQDKSKGDIVRVQKELKVLKPSLREEWQEEGSSSSEEEEEEEERGTRKYPGDNGLEEGLCSMKLKENIGNPQHADVYRPQGGRITSLNSLKLPILKFIKLSAERGVLYKNAILAPHWNINAHSVMYVTSGRARVQIVGNKGSAVFDGELKRGQLLVIPQNFAVVKQAEGSEGFEWVSFKTADNAMVNQIVGKASALRGMPVDVLMNSYGISREDARKLKFSRASEMSIFTTPMSSQGTGRD